MKTTFAMKRGLPRRRVLKLLAGAGIGNAVFGRALVALAEEKPAITGEMLAQAAWISGIELTPEERELMLEDVGELVAHYQTNRGVAIDNGVAPAFSVSRVSIRSSSA